MYVHSELVAVTFDKYKSKQLTFFSWEILDVLLFDPCVPITELCCYSFQDQKLHQGLIEVQLWKEVAVLELWK